jgi:hypothetical protein
VRVLLFTQAIEVDEGFINRIMLKRRDELIYGVEHSARNIPVQRVVRREPVDAVLLDNRFGLEERHAHSDPQSLALTAARDDVPVVIREHHDWLAFERRLKRTLAGNVKGSASMSPKVSFIIATYGYCASPLPR